MRHKTHTTNIENPLDHPHRYRGGLIGSLGVLLLLVPACGEAEEGASPQRINSEASQPRASVDLIVESPLPPELGVTCLEGTDLEAFLVIPGSESCVLTITQAEARGCCPDYPTNQSVQADLYFRRGSDGVPLGSQTKLVSLPEETTPSLSLSYQNVAFDPGSYDLDSDGTLNIDEYCAGTL